MNRWPDRRIQDVLGIEVPIIQAPMARFVYPKSISSASSYGESA